MKRQGRVSGWVGAINRSAFSGALIFPLLFAGCATPDPNPAAPLARTGYVDFYCETTGDLSWDVSLKKPNSDKTKTAYSEYRPVPGNVLRIAVPPGNHRFVVGIFNRANPGPEEIDVTVEEAKVTPVKVELKPLASYTANKKVYRFGGSSKGYAKGTKISTEQGEIVDIVMQPEPAQSYQSKERMAYFQAPAQ
jgi:hypothetical protein